MKRVLVKSVFDAFDYVMDHYYPAGLEDLLHVRIPTQSFPYKIPIQRDLDWSFGKISFVKAY